MSIRLRIFLAFVTLIAAGVLIVTRVVVGELTPHTYTAVEESLAESAALLASLVEVRATPAAIPIADLRTAMDAAVKRDLAASIQNLDKRTVDLRVYVTDARGIVLYDSAGGRDEGRDYSRWNDVYLTLRGQYGARSTRDVASDPYTSVHYVAAPIRARGRVVGVLSIGKPVRGLRWLIATMRRRVALAGLLALAAASALSFLLALWIARPLSRLAAYSTAVAGGGRPHLPHLAGREVSALARAVEAMREALAGKRYVESYVRDLTHEIKAPLSAIRAAAELLDEDMSTPDRRRFTENIRRESERLQALVDRMLELSAVEARRSLDNATAVDVVEIAAEASDTVAPLTRLKGLQLEMVRPELPVRVFGDRLLLRQALLNLIHNAIQATPPAGQVRITFEPSEREVAVRVADTGPGVPGYALARLFERFYTVPLPAQERRGTGLGLAFVREVAQLHGGTASLENRPEGGALATLRLRLMV